MGILIGILCFILVLVSLLLIGIILIQDSKGGGLSGAFGGAGGNELLGASGQKQMAKVTTVFSIGFFVLCIAIGLLQQFDDASSTAAEEEPVAPSFESPDGTGGGDDTLPGNLTITTEPGTGTVVTPGGDNAGSGTTPNNDSAPNNDNAGNDNAGTPPATPDTPAGDGNTGDNGGN